MVDDEAFSFHPRDFLTASKLYSARIRPPSDVGSVKLVVRITLKDTIEPTDDGVQFFFTELRRPFLMKWKTILAKT
ncbi:hypothetical protein J7L06_00390 [Candidatus Bathyarchaeota archaeon]|nr:hypothetical protein [Candidatus Bathyarchaeota archaeon]